MVDWSWLKYSDNAIGVAVALYAFVTYLRMICYATNYYRRGLFAFVNLSLILYIVLTLLYILGVRIDSGWYEFSHLSLILCIASGGIAMVANRRMKGGAWK